MIARPDPQLTNPLGASESEGIHPYSIECIHAYFSKTAWPVLLHQLSLPPLLMRLLCSSIRIQCNYTHSPTLRLADYVCTPGQHRSKYARPSPATCLSESSCLFSHHTQRRARAHLATPDCTAVAFRNLRGGGICPRAVWEWSLLLSLSRRRRQSLPLCVPIVSSLDDERHLLLLLTVYCNGRTDTRPHCASSC